MLARHLGGRVDFHGEGQVEVGYYPIRPTEHGRAICEVWPDHVYQWHREGFDLPPGATLLAEGDTFPVQAFRQGDNAYAIQFHPEVTHAMMCRWTIRGQHRMELPGAKQRARAFRGSVCVRLFDAELADAFPRSLAAEAASTQKAALTA